MLQKFTLRIIWLDYSIGLAIDHIVDKGYSPLSSYFFWPHHDAWNQIRTELDSKPWISQNDKIDLLNKVTLIINYWQENQSIKSIIQIQNQFPGIVFCGDY